MPDEVLEQQEQTEQKEPQGQSSFQGDEEIENGPGLLKAYQSTKDKLKEFKQKAQEQESRIKKFEDMLKGTDPDEVLRWKKVAEQRQLDEMEQNKQFEKYKQTTSAQLEQLTRENEELNKKLIHDKLDRELEGAFYEAGGKKGHFKAVAHALMPLAKLTEDGKVIIEREDGTIPVNTKQQPKTIPEYLREEFASPDSIWAPHFEPTNLNAGSGSKGSNNAYLARSNMSEADLLNLSPEDRIRVARQRGYKE
jgi:hypothetical protein